jgi:hypothetical protein
MFLKIHHWNETPENIALGIKLRAELAKLKEGEALKEQEGNIRDECKSCTASPFECKSCKDGKGGNYIMTDSTGHPLR